MRKILILAFVLVAGFMVYNRYQIPSKQKSEEKGLEKVGNAIQNTLTKNQPVPFEELTIDYLRGREYSGTLGEMELYQRKTGYNSYLTSYTSDGLKINGLLTIPSGEKPEKGWPAVVFVHGYIPPTLYKTTEKYIEYVDYLAKNGLVVFKIDLRGHGSSEGEPGGAYYSSDYVIDVLNAYNALEKNELVDRTRIGLWGHSMAGNVTFRAAITKKTIPTVVIWAGAVYSYADFVKYGLSDNSYRPAGMSAQRQSRRQQLFDTHGQFKEGSNFWGRVAGTNYLDGVVTKFSLHHAVDDMVVNVGYSRDLVDILNSKGIVNEYFEYKSGGHNITGASFSQAIRRTGESFTSH